MATTATSTIGKTRQGIRDTLIATFSTFSVIVGYQVQNINDVSFFKKLYLPGPPEVYKPALVICPATLADTDANMTILDYTVPIKLYYGHPNYQDFDGTAIDDIQVPLLKALLPGQNPVGTSNAKFITPFSFEAELHQDPVVSLFVATLHFGCGL